MIDTLKKCHEECFKECLKGHLKELVTSDVVGAKAEFITSIHNLKQFIPELKAEDVEFKYIGFLNNIIADVINALHNEDNDFACELVNHTTETAVLYTCTKAMVQLAYDEIFLGHITAGISIIAPFDVAERFLTYFARSAVKYEIIPALPPQVWNPLWQVLQVLWQVGGQPKN